MKKDFKSQNRINHFIMSHTVRLVGDNVENGVVDIKIALKLARELELDLVEISNGDIPICRIIDYSKFIYDKKKKEKELKKKQKQIQVKEIRLRPNTDDHDFNFKLNHAKKFLGDNDKVLVSVFFKGREITFKDQGQIILLRFTEKLEGIGVPESLPKMEGKKMVIMIKPIKK